MKAKLNELSLENLADWPILIKIICVVVVFSICVGVGYWFYAKSTLEQLDAEQNKELKLKDILKFKIKQVANLEAYRKQIRILEFRYNSLLQQLPNSKEVPNLVEDITSVGLNAGLTFRLIKPMDEEIVSFYAELPINMVVEGTYKQLGEFVSGVSALPRIVVIQGFSIKPEIEINTKGEEKSSNDLYMNIKATTFRYLSKSEQEAIKVRELKDD